MADVEAGPEPAQEGQDSQDGREEAKVILCETGKPENDVQTQNEKERVDEAVRDQPAESEEDKVLNGNSETISVNTKKDEGDSQGQSNTEESAEANSQKLSETETEECQTVAQADDRNNKVITVEEAEQSSPAEPMEVEATDTSTTEASAAIREEDTGTGLILH